MFELLFSKLKAQKDSLVEECVSVTQSLINNSEFIRDALSNQLTREDFIQYLKEEYNITTLNTDAEGIVNVNEQSIHTKTIGGASLSETFEFIITFSASRNEDNDCQDIHLRISSVTEVGNMDSFIGTITVDPVTFNTIATDVTPDVVSQIQLYAADTTPISISNVLSIMDNYVDISNLVSVLCLNASKGSFSISDLKAAYNPENLSQSYAATRFLNDLKSVYSENDKISPCEWYKVVCTWINEFASADASGSKIEFVEDPEFKSVLWATILPGLGQTIGMALMMVQNIWVKVAGVALTTISSVVGAILNVSGQSGEIVFNFDSPDVLLNQPGIQVSSRSNSLYYYTAAKNNGLLVVNSPMWARLLWADPNDKNLIHQEVWPRVQLDSVTLKSVLAIIGITPSDDFTSCSFGISVEAANPYGYSANSLFREHVANIINEHPLGIISQSTSTSLDNDLFLLKVVIINAMVGLYFSSSESVCHMSGRYQSWGDNAWSSTTPTLFKVFPLFIKDVCGAAGTTAVMNSWRDFLTMIRTGAVNGKSTNIHVDMINDNEFTNNIYNDDVEGTMFGIQYQELLTRHKPFATLPTFDKVMTAVASVGLAVVAVGAVVAGITLKRVFTTKLQARGMAKRQSLQAQYEQVQDYAGLYNAGLIDYSEYQSKATSYIKSVRKYNLWAGLTGVGKLTYSSPAYALASGGSLLASSSSSDNSNIIASIKDINRLIK